jgi:hypothetical protein
MRFKSEHHRKFKHLGPFICHPSHEFGRIFQGNEKYFLLAVRMSVLGDGIGIYFLLFFFLNSFTNIREKINQVRSHFFPMCFDCAWEPKSALLGTRAQMLSQYELARALMRCHVIVRSHLLFWWEKSHLIAFKSKPFHNLVFILWVYLLTSKNSITDIFVKEIITLLSSTRKWRRNNLK